VFSNLVLIKHCLKIRFSLVPLLFVPALNLIFFLASPVLFIGKSSLNMAGRGSCWQAIVIACRAFGDWCFFLASSSWFAS